MPLSPSKRSRGSKIILSLVIVLTLLLARHQISQMDERFFQASPPGIKGLALYVWGDYRGAAAAYRAHLRGLPPMAGNSEGAAFAALLRGDLETSKSLSQQSLEKDPNNIDALLNLGEIALH